MAKNNKIIPFARTQKRNNGQYQLKSEISIYIRRTVDRYTINWSTTDDSLSHEDIYSIQTSIFEDLMQKVQQIEVKKIDNYEVTFTLLYFERNSPDKEIKYICLPQTMTKEKLAEYLYTSISMYVLKTAGQL